MSLHRGLIALVILLILGGGLGPGPIDPIITPTISDPSTITIHDAATDDPLATIEVELAETASERYTGLSETDSLADGEGMLFIHDEVGEYTYVMRDMAFGLDIIFLDSDGEITTIHHAPQDSDELYEGTGQYVLEVPLGFTNRTGIEVGDRLQFGPW